MTAMRDASHPAPLRDVMLYLCWKYPHPDELSKARLTKMVYLADWRSAIERGRQLTPIEWTFNHYGPYVDDVINTARTEPAFAVHDERNMYGSPKEIIGVGQGGNIVLTPIETALLDAVITATAPLNWNDFIRLVYSTYPIVKMPRFQTLDLVTLAKEYETVKQFLR